MSRTVAALCAIFLLGGGSGFAQSTEGAGKLEVTAGGGWLSVTEGEERPEPAFGQFLFGGTLAVNWSRLGIEVELFMAPGRSQTLEFAAVSTTQTTPHVFLDTVSLVVPVMGNRRKVVPYAMAGIGEITIMRTSDDVLQPDTETFTTGNFGGGLKWYSGGRLGFRGDYRFTVVRSKFDAPGVFFGRELRKAHRAFGGIVINLIR